MKRKSVRKRSLRRKSLTRKNYRSKKMRSKKKNLKRKSRRKMNDGASINEIILEFQELEPIRKLINNSSEYGTTIKTKEINKCYLGHHCRLCGTCFYSLFTPIYIDIKVPNGEKIGNKSYILCTSCNEKIDIVFKKNAKKLVLSKAGILS
jgi:5-methylcytosine-specific restriction endonuclease McrA